MNEILNGQEGKDYIAPADEQETEAAKRSLLENEAEENATYAKLKDNPEYKKILEEKALEVSKRYDSEWFNENYNGQRDGKGYLLDAEGKPTNILPSMNHSGWTWGEAIRLANKEFESVIES